MTRSQKLFTGKCAAVLAAPVVIFAFSGGPPAARTGAPGEGNCTQCHGGTPVNGGSGNVAIVFADGGTTYVPGQTKRVRVTVTDAAATFTGFQASVRLASDTTRPAGRLAPVDTTTQVKCADETIRSSSASCTAMNGIEYIEHTGPKTGSFEFDWTAPAAGAGDVRFYVAGNAANGNGTPTGDRIYTASSTFAAGGMPPGPALPTSFRVFPQFVYGGGSPGWYTGMFFYNSGNSAASFPIHFFTASGQALSVPAAAGGTASTQTVNVPAGGMTLLDFPNDGQMRDGWVAIELPTGVFGSGVYRLVVTGRADQEAVVPLSGNTAQSVVLTFDDRDSMVTGVSVVNPTANPVTVTATARDDQGVTIGTRMLMLAALSKSVLFIDDDAAGIPAMKGKRGSVEFTTSAGAVAVLGLRARGQAFTSIPAVER